MSKWVVGTHVNGNMIYCNFDTNSSLWVQDVENATPFYLQEDAEEMRANLSRYKDEYVVCKKN